MDNKVLNVLIVDDSPDDAELPVKQLRAAGYRLKTERVYTIAGMESALQKEHWNLVLSDFTLLQYSAQMALDLLKRKKLDVPLIVVTRSISDADIAAIMAAGARDVVRKNDSGRLVPAIQRELQVAGMQRELTTTRKKISEMESRHTAMVAGTQEAVCYCQDGMHIEANKAYLNLFCYDSMEDLEVIPVLNLIVQTDQKKFKDALRKCTKGAHLESGLELDAVNKNGDRIRVEAVFSRVQLKGENTIQITFSDVSARKATEDRLQYLTQRDALTGLYNRHYFTRELNRALNAAKKENRASALIYFDLFQLEEINGTQGYTTGDGVLLKTTKLMREQLGDRGILARFGDDELAVLLEDTDLSGAKEIAVELKQAITSAGGTTNNKLYLSDCAVGAAEITADMKTVHEAVSRAVHESKSQLPATAASAHAGKATPATATSAAPETPSTTKTPSTDTGTIGKTRTASASAADDPQIAEALENNRFQLLYQPIVSMQGEAEEMYEVLVRMASEQGELISPSEFMGKAEASGQICDIDCWVLQRTIESMAAGIEQGRNVSYFVNISPNSLSSPELLMTIKNSLANSNIEAKRLVVEMSHPSVAEHMDEASRFISEVHELGCLVSLDNSGPVSEILLKLPRESVKFLKFDGNVVLELANSTDRDALTAVMDMAKQLAIRTVATHIEDAAALSEIWPFGFDYVQGHYFQHPDAHLDYEFAADDETTLSENELTAPSWSQ